MPGTAKIAISLLEAEKMKTFLIPTGYFRQKILLIYMTVISWSSVMIVRSAKTPADCFSAGFVPIAMTHGSFMIVKVAKTALAALIYVVRIIIFLTNPIPERIILKN